MSPRPWYRLHAVTWIVGTTAILALAIANLLGERRIRFFGVGPEYRYGWPLDFAFSPAIDSHAGIDVEAKPWFDRQRMREFDELTLCINAFVALLVTVGSAATTEWWRRGTSSAIQFNLKWLFAAMLGATWSLVGAFRLAASASKWKSSTP